MNYALAFRVVRAVADLHGFECAKKMKISAGWYSQIETGRRIPNVEQIACFAHACKVPPELVRMLAHYEARALFDAVLNYGSLQSTAHAERKIPVP